MEFDIKKLDRVRTADDRMLGIAQRLYHRENDINPKLQLFESYLEVENYDFGKDYFVPTDFIATRQEGEAGGIKLTVDYDEVMSRTWFRMPDFIAFGQSRKEELPPLQQQKTI